MTLGRLKSRTYARVKKKAPKRTVLHFKKRKPKAPKCSGCGIILKGVPRERPKKMQSMSKTKKRPERKYAGVLCGKCAKRKIIEEARK